MSLGEHHLSAAPNSTRIEGYIEGTPVREGDVLSLVCRSRGGNPPPNLLWLRDGISLPPEIITQRTKGRPITVAISIFVCGRKLSL